MHPPRTDPHAPPGPTTPAPASPAAHDASADPAAPSRDPRAPLHAAPDEPTGAAPPDAGPRRRPAPFTLRTLRILRPGNAMLSAVAVLVGAAFAAASSEPLLGPHPLTGLGVPARVAAAALAAFAFAAAGNLRNDLTDVDLDRRAHPTRPLVTGELSTRQAHALAVTLYAVALAAGALAAGVAGLLLVALALPLMELYERRLKQQGLAGNLAIGLLTAAPWVLGGLALGHVGAALLSVAGLAALATVGREVLKDVEDAQHDAAHRRTLPHRIGERAAARVAAVFLGAAILLSPLPWLLETVLGAAYLPAVIAADACFGAAAWTGAARPSRAQRLVKLGMLLALVALVIGRAQGGESS